VALVPNERRQPDRRTHSRKPDVVKELAESQKTVSAHTTTIRIEELAPCDACHEYVVGA